MSNQHQPTDTFCKAVQKEWGNPDPVANEGIKELFMHNDIFLMEKCEDYIEYAKQIGILAGKTANTGPESFIEGFTKLLNKKAVRMLNS